MREEERHRLEITTGSWVRGVIVVALAYAFYHEARFILVLIASIVIASAIEPVAVWAKKRNIPRLMAVILFYLLAAAFISTFFYFVLLPLIGEFSSFIRTLTIYSNSVVNDSVLSSMFVHQNVFGGPETTQIAGQLSIYLNTVSNFLSQGIFSSLSAVSGGVISFILIIVLSFYLSVQADGITKFLKIITPLKHEPYVINLWKRTQTKIGKWMQGQLLLGALVMVLVYFGLLVLNVPHALLLAFIAGIFEIIPLFGPIFSAIPGVLSAYTASGMSLALIVAVLYLVIQQFENHVIYPLVVKKVIGIPPIVSIIALVVGGELGGFLGVVVAVPVATAIMEFLNDLEEEKIAKMAAMSESK